MSFDLDQLLASHRGSARSLHSEHVNPKWMHALKLIGFDHEYVRGESQYLWDANGNRYLDMIGGYAVCNVGRNHPVIRKALTDFLASQTPSMVQFDASILPGLLARHLKGRVGRDLDRVFFTNSGTEGIEAAIKFSRCATGKPEMLYEKGAFHGLSTGALAMNGCESFRSGFEPHPKDFRALPFNDLVALERELSRGDVAGFVVEPIQGKGVNMHSYGFLAKASALCHRYGALFVVDEVQTGIGRTGSFLAIDQEGAVEADIIVLSKGLSGGYVPVGAVMTKTSVWEKVFSRLDRAIVHSSTFHMSGLAMVAGLATLSVLENERLAENATQTGALLRNGLEAMKPRFELLGAIRQRGLMIGIEFAKPRSPTLRMAWRMIHALDVNLFTQAVTIPLMQDHKILSQVAGHGIPVLKLTPPLTIDADDVRHFLSAFEKTMLGIHRFHGPAWDALRRIAINSLRPRNAAPKVEQESDPQQAAAEWLGVAETTEQHTDNRK
ncbi:MAG: aspartate aminotransferase family protein [Planctomycetota bacterium]|nr:aspartate aminotransferase family protein [Planctomycetota bacterium]MDA1262684.1 aspartate aminotransferase family protein [Planctomycetota bacterium]